VNVGKGIQVFFVLVFSLGFKKAKIQSLGEYPYLNGVKVPSALELAIQMVARTSDAGIT